MGLRGVQPASDRQRGAEWRGDGALPGGACEVLIASDVAAVPYRAAYTALIQTMYDLTTREATETETKVELETVVEGRTCTARRVPFGSVVLCSKLRHSSETDEFFPLFEGAQYCLFLRH